ncbi:MAG: MFS transporter [Lachnospiraceae bacterium]|nr:MFS transporter [Candidatus Equihabitans merdae]
MTEQTKDRRYLTGMVVTIILTAFCLRAPITGVGSLVSMIKEDLHIASAAAGMLTTIPLLAFGAFSFFIGGLSRRFGTGYVALASMALMILGLISRSFLGSTGLFAGSLLIGMGIAAGNVLLPAIIKAVFPNKIGVMTSLYTTSLSAFAGISAGISVPLAFYLGWKGSLFIWIIPATAALIAWIPFRSLNLATSSAAKASPALKAAADAPADGPTAVTLIKKERSVLSSGKAWLIAFFLGVHSMIYGGLIAWISTIIQSKGFDVTTGGFFNSYYLLLGIITSITTPIIMTRKKTQTSIGVGIGTCYFFGVLGIFLFHNLPALIIATTICGLCNGSCLSFSMTVLALRAKNAQDSAQLSGLAQSIGFMMSAIAPALLGKIFDLTGTWTAPLGILMFLALLMAGLSFIVGKPFIINED